ncbi:MAG: glycosyltransferase [Myxococcales bacterium]
MKVLLGVVYYEPAWAYGGPPRMVFDLARELVRRGHEVTVCTTDALDDGKRVPKLEEVSHGVRIVRFPNLSNRVAFHLKIFLPIGMRYWLDEHVREFDVVHLFDARTMLNAWASQAAFRHGVPFFVSVWGSLPRGEGWRAAIKAYYDRHYADVQIGKASRLLAQNAHEAALYLDYGGRKDQVAIWPLGVDPAEFRVLPARGELRSKLGIPPDAPVVLFVGRISELKGLEPLLRAFAQAKRRVPAARLVVVGRDDGYLQSMLSLARELGIESSLHFVGPLYGSDVLPAYIDADLFAITPTHFEETSLASLTAAAVGRPMLINDRCGVPWLDEYDAGRCVPHGVDAIASALSELLADAQRLQRMGENAKRMSDERFLLPRVVDQVERLYEGARGAALSHA